MMGSLIAALELYAIPPTIPTKVKKSTIARPVLCVVLCPVLCVVLCCVRKTQNAEQHQGERLVLRRGSDVYGWRLLYRVVRSSVEGRVLYNAEEGLGAKISRRR